MLDELKKFLSDQGVEVPEGATSDNLIEILTSLLKAEGGDQGGDNNEDGDQGGDQGGDDKQPNQTGQGVA